MKHLLVTKQFKKDIKKLKRQGKNLDKLKIVIDKICEGQTLEEKYHDHKLIGDYEKAKECHIEPDWLLIYEEFEESIKLRRTGSHSELFKM